MQSRVEVLAVPEAKPPRPSAQGGQHTLSLLSWQVRRDFEGTLLPSIGVAAVPTEEERGPKWATRGASQDRPKPGIAEPLCVPADRSLRRGEMPAKQPRARCQTVLAVAVQEWVTWGHAAKSAAGGLA